MAHAIWNSIGYNYNPGSLKLIPGMTQELMERIRSAFIIDDLPNPPSGAEALEHGDTPPSET
jgi:hypothetical protein